MDVSAGNGPGVVQEPAVLQGLRATWVSRTREPGVYNLSWNLVVWVRGLLRGGRRKDDKRALVAALAQRYPNVIVWIGDWTSDEDAHRLLGVPLEPEAGATEYVLVTDPKLLLALLPHLDEGGWTMIFLCNPPASAPVRPDAALPDDPAGFKRFIHSIGGCAAIDSWYDDVSWMVLID